LSVIEYLNYCNISHLLSDNFEMVQHDTQVRQKAFNYKQDIRAGPPSHQVII
jgi:hypothetical protein